MNALASSFPPIRLPHMSPAVRRTCRVVALVKRKASRPAARHTPHCVNAKRGRPSKARATSPQAACAASVRSGCRRTSPVIDISTWAFSESPAPGSAAPARVTSHSAMACIARVTAAAFKSSSSLPDILFLPAAVRVSPAAKLRKAGFPAGLRSLLPSRDRLSRQAGDRAVLRTAYPLVVVGVR